jgi:hypothetical protein
MRTTAGSARSPSRTSIRRKENCQRREPDRRNGCKHATASGGLLPYMQRLRVGNGSTLCQRRFIFDHTAPVSWPIEHQERGRVSQTSQGGARLLCFP